MLHTLPASYQASADPRYESMISTKTANCGKIDWKTCECKDSDKKTNPLTNPHKLSTRVAHKSLSSSTLPYIHSILVILALLVL